jgi:AcrR family transcriptional regulator
LENIKKAAAWTEQGYILFSQGGMDGIHIEKLARMLNLNKSGFYHYFGDVEGFYSELITLHNKYADLYFAEMRDVTLLDPDYLNLVLKYKIFIMFHVQLLRRKDKPEFIDAAEEIDRRESGLISGLWSQYIGLTDNPALALRYFDVVRDAFYARIKFENFNYEYLHNLLTETKMLMHDIAESKAARDNSEPVV